MEFTLFTIWFPHCCHIDIKLNRWNTLDSGHFNGSQDLHCLQTAQWDVIVWEVEQFHPLQCTLNLENQVQRTQMSQFHSSIAFTQESCHCVQQAEAKFASCHVSVCWWTANALKRPECFFKPFLISSMLLSRRLENDRKIVQFHTFAMLTAQVENSNLLLLLCHLVVNFFLTLLDIKLKITSWAHISQSAFQNYKKCWTCWSKGRIQAFEFKHVLPARITCVLSFSWCPSMTELARLNSHRWTMHREQRLC